MSSKPYRHFIALLLVLFCSRFEAQAEDLFAKTDSTLQQYLIRCKAQIKDPDFLQTNDTLTRMAQEKNDKRMQVIAVALKLDYYYYQNNPDSILVMVERVKKISRRNNELKYFYFAWGSRLIIYYIKQHQTNTAIYEARKMLQSAEADNFIPGIVQCYRTLGTIYMTQSNPKLAYENFRKQIALIEENEIEDINLPTQYASLAQCALEMHRPDEALKALEKGSKCTRSSYQIFTVQKAYILYYLETKEYEKARKTLVELEQLFEKDKSLTLYKSGLFYIQIEYYRNTGQYRKALDVIEEIKNDSSSINKYLDYTLSQKQGDIYWEKNQKARAAQYYRDYILSTDSIRSQEIQNSTNEFYTIMEVEQLHKEKNELLLHMQEEKLQKINIALVSLVIILVAGTMLLFHISKLNKKLKRSEAKVIQQNKELVENGTIGNVINVQIRFAQPPRDLDYNRDNLPWRVQADIAGGGYFYDLAPHQIDLLQDMFGCILEASGYKSNRGGLYPAEDTLSACFQFDNGLVGSGSWCFVAHDSAREDRIEIIGDKGMICFSVFTYDHNGLHKDKERVES